MSRTIGYVEFVDDKPCRLYLPEVIDKFVVCFEYGYKGDFWPVEIEDGNEDGYLRKGELAALAYKWMWSNSPESTRHPWPNIFCATHSRSILVSKTKNKTELHFVILRVEG